MVPEAIVQCDGSDRADSDENNYGCGDPQAHAAATIRRIARRTSGWRRNRSRMRSSWLRHVRARNGIRRCVAGAPRAGGTARRARRVRVALQALQVAAEFCRGLVAQVAIFFERFSDDLFQLGGQRWIERGWRWGRAIQNSVENNR